MKNKQIEAIRGIFGVMVVCYHLFVRYIQLYVDEQKRFGIFDYFGSLGVIVFLLISAYFLVSKEKTDVNFSLRVYYTRKIKRLWPLYAVSILLIFFITNIMCRPVDRLVEIKDLILNLFFINGFAETSFVDGAHWYITTLIKFTIVIGIIKKMRMEHKWYSYVIWMILIIILKFFRVPVLCSILCDPYVGIIGVATMLRYGLVDDTKSIKEKLMWLIPLLLGIMYLYVFNGWITIIEVVIASMVIYVALHYNTKVLNSKVLLYLGSISYPLYLIHQNISYGLITILSELVGQYKVIFSVIALAISIVLATLLYCIGDKKKKEGN